MINITEKKLKAAIQIILGSEGIHTCKLEEDLVYGIKALSIYEVSSRLKVLSFEEDAEALTKEIHKLEDRYINADECVSESEKIYIGTELKRLRKLRENL